jgi:hypothetical protein
MLTAHLFSRLSTNNDMEDFAFHTGRTIGSGRLRVSYFNRPAGFVNSRSASHFSRGEFDYDVSKFSVGHPLLSVSREPVNLIIRRGSVTSRDLQLTGGYISLRKTLSSSRVACWIWLSGIRGTTSAIPSPGIRHLHDSSARFPESCLTNDLTPPETMRMRE